MSIGFLVEPNAGVAGSKISLSEVASSYILTSNFSHASVASTPIPPPLVMTTVFSPFGMPVPGRNLQRLKASLMLSARRTPHWRMTASKISSDPASEPVCEAAATAPRFERPDLITTTGFFRVAVLRTSTRRPPFFTPSMYMKMTSVMSSSIR